MLLVPIIKQLIISLNIYKAKAKVSKLSTKYRQLSTVHILPKHLILMFSVSGLSIEGLGKKEKTKVSVSKQKNKSTPAAVVKHNTKKAQSLRKRPQQINKKSKITLPKTTKNMHSNPLIEELNQKDFNSIKNRNDKENKNKRLVIDSQPKINNGTQQPEKKSNINYSLLKPKDKQQLWSVDAFYQKLRNKQVLIDDLIQTNNQKDSSKHSSRKDVEKKKSQEKEHAGSQKIIQKNSSNSESSELYGQVEDQFDNYHEDGGDKKQVECSSQQCKTSLEGQKIPTLPIQQAKKKAVEKKVKQPLLKDVKNKPKNIKKNSQTQLLYITSIQNQNYTKLLKYFMYYPVSIIQLAGMKQFFLKQLQTLGDFLTYNPLNQLSFQGSLCSVKQTRSKQSTNHETQKKIKHKESLSPAEQTTNLFKKKRVSITTQTVKSPVQDSVFLAKKVQTVLKKMTKVAELKSKYKYREKFNYMYSTQLKALNFKKKQFKKKKQSSSESQSDEDEKKEKARDFATWKKSMGLNNSSKVFIIKGRYNDIRNALLERGWVENPDKHSTYFDLKWTTKVNDIIFETLKPNQIVNHFNNNACLTSKYGICKSLRSVMLNDGINIDRFFPKAYDLVDLGDFQNFLEVYKWIYCESVLKKFIEKVANLIGVAKDLQNKQIMEQIKTVSTQLEQNSAQITDKFNKVQLQRVKISLIVTCRRMQKNIEALLWNTLKSRYNLCSITEWKCIYHQQQVSEGSEKYDKAQSISKEKIIKLFKKGLNVLSALKQWDPQTDLNGSANSWIVKPAFLSRGRGIKCLTKLNDILNYSLGKETQYVVQKYIQNPLIIEGKKFDIRQWVVVEDYNPAKIWMYNQFYLRFCVEKYDPSKLNNKYAHLTNNSIQKYNKKLSQEELRDQLRKSMWSQQEFQGWLNDRSESEQKIKKIRGKMREIIIATILSTNDQVYGRKNSFQLIGYDFMLDDQLNPWLIEINTSPAMDYSTPVTARLVKMLSEDTVKLMVDQSGKKIKKNKTVGGFKCIHSGQSKFIPKHYVL